MFGRKKLLARIEVLEARIQKLENMHASVMPKGYWELPANTRLGAHWETDKGIVGFYGDRQLTAREVQFHTRHPQPAQIDYKRITNVPNTTVDTNRVSKVSLEELARLVIDGTPIRREEKIASKRISEYTEDTTTRITVTE